MSHDDIDQPPATGHPEIDAALAALDLSGPVEEHAGHLQAVQSVLSTVLNPQQQHQK